MKTKPLFIVMSAPSGCGKTTLIDMLLQEYSDIVYSISCTTRKPREGEEDGLDYHFLTRERFEELLKQNAFLESAKVHDNYYGTLKAPIIEVLNEGNSMILDIDVQGAAKVRDYSPARAISPSALCRRFSITSCESVPRPSSRSRRASMDGGEMKMST